MRDPFVSPLDDAPPQQTTGTDSPLARLRAMRHSRGSLFPHGADEHRGRAGDESGAASEAQRRAASDIADAMIAFASEDKRLESAYQASLALVAASARPSPAGGVMLIEGENYQGCWLESTGSASAELLSRFCPALAQSTFLSFAILAREDGLIPYKITESKAAFRQIQMVTPLARSVWNHAMYCDVDRAFLSRMYGAMSANDEWLARHRDSRGSGCVEAFCAFDTGHDLSPRFWHLPDTCYREDPALYDPDCPTLPFLAPDLTANVHCQRLYLARLARRLGREQQARGWEAKAAASLTSLMRECYDEGDGCFYDRDASGQLVRLQSDIILRVFACEVGDDSLFEAALKRYLLNSRKFFAKYPPTSVAMDDPRFDSSSSRNSWAGPTNLLSLIRAPAAFEPHRRFVELSYFMKPTLRALSSCAAFPQCLDPWSGTAGYGTNYTPAALCLLDFVERSAGILSLPDRSIRFSSIGDSTSAYSRRLGDSLFELESDADSSRVYLDGKSIIEFPSGLLVFTDMHGRVSKIVDALPRKVSGKLHVEGAAHSFCAQPNQVLAFDGEDFRTQSDGGFVLPS